jgi:hypothetical protein
MPARPSDKDRMGVKTLDSVHISKRTPHFTITYINWLTLFKEIIAVCSENHTEPTNTKYSATDRQDSWDI